MMKRIFSLLLVLMSVQTVISQSAYISYRPYEKADRFESLNGKRGILILSKRSDLVITATNAPEIQASGLLSDVLMGCLNTSWCLMRKVPVNPK